MQPEKERDVGMKIVLSAAITLIAVLSFVTLHAYEDINILRCDVEKMKSMSEEIEEPAVELSDNTYFNDVMPASDDEKKMKEAVVSAMVAAKAERKGLKAPDWASVE